MGADKTAGTLSSFLSAATIVHTTITTTPKHLSRQELCFMLSPCQYGPLRGLNQPCPPSGTRHALLRCLLDFETRNHSVPSPCGHAGDIATNRLEESPWEVSVES